MTRQIEERYYVFEREGPYAWQVAAHESGPYYDTKEWFDADGYESEADAKTAITDFLLRKDAYERGPFFIVKGYQACEREPFFIVTGHQP